MSDRSNLTPSGLVTIFSCACLFSCGVANADPTPSPPIAATPSHSPANLGDMIPQELRDKFRREGAKGNSFNVKVPPVGVYATIDGAPTSQTMAALQTSTATARSDLIHQIESNPGDYAPPVFYILAKVLYQDGNIDDALFWFTAGQLRCTYDGMRCTDKSAASAFGALNLGMPPGLFKAEMNDPDRYRMIADKVLQWDATTPYNYDCRWIALHGLKALQSGITNTPPQKDQPLTVPADQWESLAKQNREAFQKAAEAVVAMGKAHQAEENLAPGTIVSAAGPTVTFEKRIDLPHLSDDSNIFAIAYSPDGNCLALAISNLLGTQPPKKPGIVVWNLTSGKVQTQFEVDVPVTLAGPKLTWSPDGRFLTLGAQRGREPVKFWNPLTGTAAHTLELTGDGGTFNRDGKKFAILVRTAGFVDVPIYDTETWKYTVCDTYPVTPEIIGWTGSDKIFVVGRVKPYTRSSAGHTPTPADQSEADRSIKLDDTVVKKSDIVLRLIDPADIEPSKTVVLPPDLFPLNDAVVSFASDKIVLDAGTIVDGKSLDVSNYYTQADVQTGLIPVGYKAFSPDGTYIYHSGRVRGNAETKYLIIKTSDGSRLSAFQDYGTGRMAVSPDSTHIATAEDQVIKIYSVKP